MNSVKNLFADIPENLREELVETILQASSFRIERIVSRGHCSPDGFWYDQDEHEWVILLKGSAVLRFEDQSENISMNPGDYINIEKHRRHRVEWTDLEQETIWLAIHYQVRNKK
jgi:cupin 2 domain-containing protein